ncbi:uncharacterized protein LOC133915347 [Phragmites australis]|uniref:uncharacterized protein LOC133915347 n=1 Tax=Phragmites australis TaxID=29695 RepID=UPI002D786349|nr:uncharacterized protein LOC133915347 [Phragmites australis]
MSRGSKLRWLWRAPARALGRARDLYVRGLTGCARYVPAEAAFGYPVFVPASLSRSHSVAGSDWSAGGGSGDDLRDLVRAASQKRVDQRERERELQAVARSQSMAALSMARIDEDAPCEFGDGAGALYPRSQSCVGGAAGLRARGHLNVAAYG